MRTYPKAPPRAVALVQLGYGDIDLYIEKIEARAARRQREQAERKARNAKIGIRTFSWEG